MVTNGMERIHPLKEFRDRQTPPLTQDQLAEFLGVSKASVSRWETGTRKIENEKVLMVAERTGIAPDLLRPDLAKLLGRPEAAE